MAIRNFPLLPSPGRAIVFAATLGCVTPCLHAAPRTVEAADETVSGERIAQVARQRVLDELATLGLRGSVEVVQTPSDVTVPRGKAVVRVHEPLHFSAGTNGMARHASAEIDISTSDRHVQSTVVSLEVTTFGALLTQAGAATARTEPTARERNTPPTLVAPSGSASQNPPTETSLRSLSRSSDPPARQVAIRRGAYTTLRAVDGTIQLESRAQALEDGRAGQSIQVRLVSSTDAILAKVTPNGQLELLP
jgi:hypothetical protein